MSWCAVDVHSPADERDAVATWLVGRTGQAVEEKDDGTLVGFAETSEAAGALLAELGRAFGPGIVGEAHELPQRDWRVAWRDGLGPRRLGRLTVAPTWTAAAQLDDPCITIDPETAFGTGEHGSTRTALLLLDRTLRPGDRVLDLGSGSGILAIAAVRLGASRATGIELDSEAEPVARANATRNGVLGAVSFVTGDAAALAPLLGPVELVLSNILRSQNEALLPAVKSVLAPGGHAIFAGMEQAERPLFLAALGAAGFRAGEEAEDDGWWGVTAGIA